MDKIRRIAIIPARSGSKGLLNKNIKLLDGKPLMAYSIDSAIKSGIFDTVFVSTDSDEYEKIATSYGAEVPFLRSEIQSSDTASSWDVVREVLEEYSKRGECFDEVMLLQPTSPLRNVEDILGAMSLMKKTCFIRCFCFSMSAFTLMDKCFAE